MSTTHTSQPPLSGLITAMFTDIVGSTELKGAMPADTARGRDAEYRSSVKDPHDSIVLEHICGGGGHRAKSTGDGFLFTFGDVDDAVLCALAVQDCLKAQPIQTPIGPLRIRIGIHTGPADPSDADFTAATVDKAARVQAQAAPGEVLVSKETRALIQLKSVAFDAIDADLRGLGTDRLYRASRSRSLEPHGAHQPEAALADLENPYDFATTANQRTFKGRRAELEQLLDSIQTATHTAIFGLQRTGKTSLIEQGLRAELDAHERLRNSILVASIDMQRLGGAQVTYRDFVHAILEAVIAQLAALGVGRDVQNLRALTREVFTAGQYQRGDRSEFFSVFAKLLQQLAGASNRRVVLFIDEFSEIRKVIERNKVALQRNPGRTANLLPHDMYIDVPFIHHLSSLLKDPTLKQKITFVVIVRPFIAEYDEQEGLQLLKLMKPITLGRLDESAARELIVEPLGSVISYEEGAVDYLVDLTAGHPYLIQFILKLIVDKIKRNGRILITVNDVRWIAERMVAEGPSFDAQFAVLISDYSIDEVTHPKEARLGKGMLALISKFGEHNDGWVPAPRLFHECSRYKIPEEKTASLLSQLTRTRILEERDSDDALEYRLSVPLVRERFVRLNLYKKYFRKDGD